MRKLVVIPIVLSILACEGSKTEQVEKESTKVETANYKEYFSPTVLDGKTRYFLFDETTVYEDQEAVNSKAIRRIQKMNDSILIAVEFTQYADTVILADSSIMVMREDGIHFKESYMNGGEDWLALDLDPGLSIPWKWKQDSIVKFSWSVVRNGIQMDLMSERIFAGFEEKKLKSFGKTKVAIREDEQLRTTDGKKSANKAISWDVPGLGLYRYEILAEGYSYVMEFEKELTEVQYKELMGR